MACRWSQQSDNESEVSDLDYDVPVGGEAKSAPPAFECDGRRTDGAVKLEDEGAAPELFKHTDESLKKRCLIRDSFRRDDAKRSRPPSTPEAWTRQCRGRAERPDVVNMQGAWYVRPNLYVEEVEVAPLQAPCGASRLFSSISRWDTSDFGSRANHHRTSWRDGATDSMTGCMLSLGGRPALDMRRMEMVAARGAGFETDNRLIHVPDERGDVECIVDVYSEPNTNTNLQRSPTYPLLEKLVCPLNSGDKEYEDIEKMFRAGLGSFSSGTIVTGISRDASLRGQERLQAFEKLKEITRKTRGDENERFAWHGTSKTGVSGIFLHGFGQPRTAKNGSAYGVGVYLAPEGLSHISAVYADDDENGEQHVVLCRVILGASELVAYGSDQFHPSTEEYDSGVDDLANPKRLIVWSTHMNTHILPLYVVSFRLPQRWHQMMAAHPGKTASIHTGAPMNQFCTARQKFQDTSNETGAGSFRKRGPTSPFISFPHLFLLLSPLLAPERLQCLQNCHREFKARRLTRQQLIQHLRNEVGDHRLLHAIKLLQGSQMPNGQEQVKHESPIPFPAVEGVRCETPLPCTAIEKFQCGTPLSFTSIEKPKCESTLAAVNLSSTGLVANVQARTVFETR